MRLALINDTHAGARGDNPHMNDFFFRFWDDIFFPSLRKHRIDHVIHLGDVVDRRKFINFAIWHKWKTDFFDRLHNEFKYGSLNVALVPWINSGNYERTAEYLKTTSAPVIFGHLEIAGFEMDRGNVCLAGLTKAMFDRFDMVLTGHFHHRSSDGVIYYLGNQYEITWADYNDPRGFHIFDTETRELTFIENPYRLFHKFTYDDSVQNFEYWKQHNFQTYKNAYIKWCGFIEWIHHCIE